jgi:hypothetical protein
MRRKGKGREKGQGEKREGKRIRGREIGIRVATRKVAAFEKGEDEGYDRIS